MVRASPEPDHACESGSGIELHGMAQFAEFRRELTRLVVGVKAAGAGQQPDAGLSDPLRLQSQGSILPPECCAIGAHPQDGNVSRAELSSFHRKPPSARYQLLAAEFVSRIGGAIHNIGDAIAEGEQVVLLVRIKPPRRETGRVQRWPESVARPGEVMLDGRGVQPWIDAAEEHAQPGRYDVRQTAPVGGGEFLAGRFVSSGHF